MKHELFCAPVVARAIALSVSATALAQAPSTTRASVDSSGAQSNSSSAYSSMSADGRYVAFESQASNLVAGDTNGSNDIFVRDRVAGTTERVSLATGGGQGNSASQSASISADGRVVAFISACTNLVAGDTNSAYDVFARDRVAGTTERMSVDSGGAQSNGSVNYPAISGDGRFVAFECNATNLVPGDTNTYIDVFVRDRVNHTTERASLGPGGIQANSDCTACSISDDGRFVAFTSDATNLDPTDMNGVFDVFVRDRANGTTERASRDSSEIEGNAQSTNARISGDGRFVAFESFASNLVAGDTNFLPDAFVRDCVAGTTERVSVATGGAQGNSFSVDAVISASGRFVAFYSLASNLVAGDTNGGFDVFLRDRALGTTERMSVTSSGAQASGGSGTLVIGSVSADGRSVAFWSGVNNLVTGDTNGNPDVFVRDRGPQPPSVYCTSGTSSNGCAASISASANPSVSLANACSVAVASVDGQKSGILFYGVNNLAFLASPWASGSTSFLCVKPPTQRTAIQSSGGTANACDGAFVLDWNAFQSANPTALGNPWTVGAKAYVQAWFRDPPAPKATNLSDAVELTYVP